MLKNSNKRFSGLYTQMTEDISGGVKRRGDPYTFVETGDFLGNFHLSDKLSIFSTGTGSGLKHDFFAGYKNMFGLTQENEDMILKEVKDFIGMQILNGLWE